MVSWMDSFIKIIYLSTQSLSWCLLHWNAGKVYGKERFLNNDILQLSHTRDMTEWFRVLGLVPRKIKPNFNNVFLV